MIGNASDYDDMFIVSKSDTEEKISNAEHVYKVIKKYVDEKLTE